MYLQRREQLTEYVSAENMWEVITFQENKNDMQTEGEDIKRRKELKSPNF